jgi:hypothetical protein
MNSCSRLPADTARQQQQQQQRGYLSLLRSLAGILAQTVAPHHIDVNKHNMGFCFKRDWAASFLQECHIRQQRVQMRAGLLCRKRFDDNQLYAYEGKVEDVDAEIELEDGTIERNGPYYYIV